MRSRDLHILTSSEFAFSSDPRFGPEHMPGSDAWTLRLDSARKSDSGRYECQVNTEPKIMYAVQLSVRGDCYSLLFRSSNPSLLCHTHTETHVVSCVPSTPSRRHLIDLRQFSISNLEVQLAVVPRQFRRCLLKTRSKSFSPRGQNDGDSVVFAKSSVPALYSVSL